jgi:hypothetical protein
MKRFVAFAFGFIMTTLSGADEIILQNENVIEWKSLMDKGDSIDVVLTNGKKMTVKKSDIKEIRVKAPALLTGASFTLPEPIKVASIDLLKAVDPKKDKIQGSWEFEGSTLKTKHEGVFQQLQLPMAPAEEYDLKMIVERKGAQCLNLFLPLSQKKAAQVVINTGANSSGIFPIDGTTHQSPGKNETYYGQGVFQEGKPSTVSVMVRKTRIVIEVDNKPIIDWKIDLARLGTNDEWKPKRQDALMIGAWCDFLFHKIEFTGAGKSGH